MLRLAATLCLIALFLSPCRSGAWEPLSEPQIFAALDRSFVFAPSGEQSEFRLTITNTGAATLEVFGIDFWQHNVEDLPDSFSGDFQGHIAPGDSVEVPLFFTPLREWSGFNPQVRVFSNAGQVSRWFTASSVPPDLRSVVFGNGRFLATGARGSGPAEGISWLRAFTSEDGETWHHTPRLLEAVSIAFGSGRFVSVNMTGAIGVSENGDHWASVLSEPVDALSGVKYLGDHFYAFGPSGVRYRSPDGLAWEELPAQSVYLRDLSLLQGTFVGVGATRKLFLSTDLLTWEELPSPDRVLRLAASGESLVALRTDGRVSSTSDFVTWETYHCAMATLLMDVIFHDGAFTAVGFAFGGGSGVAVQLTSFDGMHWEEASLNDANLFFGLAANDDTVVFVGRDGAILSLARETDEIRWKRGRTSMIFHGVASDGESVVVVGEGGLVWKRGENGSWLRKEAGTIGRFWDVIHAHGRYVAVGEHGAIRVSANGAEWTAVEPEGWEGTLGGVAFGQGTFIAVGGQGTVVMSETGDQWTRVDSGASEQMWGVTAGAPGFVAVGEQGKILFSETGESWQQITISWGSHWWNQVRPFLTSVTYATHGYIAVGETGVILHSPDGLQWTRRESGFSGYLERVRFVGGRYVATGSHGIVLTSLDGMFWQPEPAPTSQAIFGLSDFGRRILLAGDGETLFQQYLGPVIHQNPQSAMLDAGADQAFQIGAEGIGNLTYEWRRNGETIATSTEPSLILSQVDRSYEGAYTTVVSDDEGATVSLPATLTVRLTVENWLRQAGLIAEDADPDEIREAMFAPGSDGLPRLLRYAFPGEPGDPSTLAAIHEYESGAKFFSVRFTRLKPPHDLAYELQVSDDLHSWSSLTSPHIEVLDSGADFETVRVFDDIPLSGRGTKHFFRIVIAPE